MSSKINWYREVLALEPGSRVFFALAKLLRDAGRAEEAVATLRGGLAFHPDHLEAKFLLVDLLAGKAGQTIPAQELKETLDCLIDVLTRYPAFWDLWAGQLAASSRDCALAARMLAAHLGGADIDFASLLEKGLAASGAHMAAARPASPAGPVGPDETEGTGETPPPPPLRGADEVRAVLGGLGGAAPEKVAPAQAAAEAGPFSGVRTRTMAEVLAGQGDIKGAVEIYEELHGLAAPAEKPALAERLTALREKLSPASGATGETGAPDKNKLMGVLEKLASRLEARTGA
jgi:tetratricopeptide (TPR) repeat protein